MFALFSDRPEHRATVRIGPVRLKEASGKTLMEDVSGHLIDAIGIIVDFRRLAVFPLHGDVVQVPVVLLLKHVIFPAREQLHEIGYRLTHRTPPFG